MTNQTGSNSVANADEMLERGKKLYDEVQQAENIEKDYQGQYIAIDTASGEHFIGATRDEAVKKGKEKYPTVVFFVKRIGGIDTVARHHPFDYSARNSAIASRIL